MRKVSTTSVELLSDGVRRCFLDCHSLTSEAFAARLGGSSCHQIRQRESLVKGSLIERTSWRHRPNHRSASTIEFAVHLYRSSREYRTACLNVAGKGGKRIERCLISTFQVAESMGFKGDFRLVGTPAANWRLKNHGLLLFTANGAMRPECPILLGRYKLLSAVFRCQVILDCLGIFADPGLDRR